MAMEYVKLGYHIGLGGVVTFKNAKKAKETAIAIPLEKLLLETDAPYMAPTPHRGTRNNSIYIDYVAAEIAALRGIPKEEVIARTEENARKLFL
jgi:TatD DNase family protein